MDQYKPSKDQTVEDYLSDIHALAAARKGGSLKPIQSKSDKDRLDRNRNDVSGRLNNGRSPSPSKERVDTPQPKNLKEAIALAEEQLKETFK